MLIFSVKKKKKKKKKKKQQQQQQQQQQQLRESRKTVPLTVLKRQKSPLRHCFSSLTVNSNTNA